MTFSAIVLAGGKSRRMGTDKRNILLHDQTLLQHAIQSVQNLSNDIIISANDLPEIDLPYKYIPDITKESGPLGGLVSTLPEIKHPQALVVSCDMPFIQEKHLHTLISNFVPEKILIFNHENQIQPFPGIYPKSIYERMIALMKTKKLKMRFVLEELNAEMIDTKDQVDCRSFMNINSPEDLRKARNV